MGVAASLNKSGGVAGTSARNFEEVDLKKVISFRIGAMERGSTVLELVPQTPKAPSSSQLDKHLYCVHVQFYANVWVNVD